MSPVKVCVSTGMLDGRVPANAAGALRRCCVSSYRDDHIVPGPGARLKRRGSLLLPKALRKCSHT